MHHFPTRTPDQLAAVLRGLRKQRGFTQKQAAAKVGLLPKTISAMESDPARASVRSLYKLLSALDVELVLKPGPGASTPTDDAAW